MGVRSILQAYFTILKETDCTIGETASKLGYGARDRPETQPRATAFFWFTICAPMGELEGSQMESFSHAERFACFPNIFDPHNPRE